MEKMDRDAKIKRNFQARGGERRRMDERTGKRRKDKVDVEVRERANVRRRIGCFFNSIVDFLLLELLCSSISADFSDHRQSMAFDLPSDWLIFKVQRICDKNLRIFKSVINSDFLRRNFVHCYHNL